MYRNLLLLCVLSLALASSALSQTCQRDSNLLQTKQLLSPAPYYPDSPFYNLKEACINEPYNQSVTVFVPDTFTYLGFKVPIQSVSIALSNAILNYPAGMVYSCDPPNCVFSALSLGCILLHGTPAPSNQPDTFDLGISVKVKTLLGEVPLVLPRDINPDYHYYLILKEEGKCQVSTHALEEPFSTLRLMPNPTPGPIYIEASSRRDGAFRVEVFDLFGRAVHQQWVSLHAGENRFEVESPNLPAGTYVVVVRDDQTRTVRRLVRM